MAAQQYTNHTRYYPAHHFIFYPLVLTALIICIKNYQAAGAGNKAAWLMMGAIVFLLGFLSFMTRQHYGLINQNRTVRLEMRLRYYQLTQKRLETIEQQISFNQLAALRFAGDGELIALIDKTLEENLSPAAIKKLITDWQPDYMRV